MRAFFSMNFTDDLLPQATKTEMNLRANCSTAERVERKNIRRPGKNVPAVKPVSV